MQHGLWQGACDLNEAALAANLIKSLRIYIILSSFCGLHLSQGLAAVSTIIASMLPIGVLLWIFAQGGPIAANPIPVIALTLAYVLVAGIVIASVPGVS